MNVYTLDAGFAAAIILLTVLVVAATRTWTPDLAAPEEELAELLKEPGFINAVYEGDSRTIEAYLNSFLSCPYNFTVYSGGSKVLSVGTEVQGVAAVAELPGWRGTRRVLVVSLRVGV